MCPWRQHLRRPPALLAKDLRLTRGSSTTSNRTLLFLAKFSIQKAHDNGEFFTPSSIVQTIVNVIEPNHGTAFDPACGSGGMFVQSSHFVEHEGGDTAKKVVFYGQEKNRDTIGIAKMNLAVHGLEGKIAEAITYYQDEHTLAGKCDFVLFKGSIGKAERERLKQASRGLRSSLRDLLRPMQDWTQKASTQAEVKIFILDNLYRALPRPPFSEAETEEIAERVYEYVRQRSASGQDLLAA